MKILVTGGCGFIGSNFIRYILKAHPDWEVVNLDALTYAGNPANLAEVAGELRYKFIHGRIEEPQTVHTAVRGCSAVINFAAETHVDRSIVEPAVFIRTNVVGTQVLVDVCREKRLSRFIQISTDEVYGSLGAEGRWTEDSPLQPRSPYSASKAAADLLVLAAFRTWGVPVNIIRPSNNYGPYQYPEKLIPLAITNLLEGRKVPVYGQGENWRDWIYVEDTVRAIELVLLRGVPGEVYNVGAGAERRNIDVVRRIAALLGKGEGEIEFVADRPGHDFRYALDTNKIRQLGWEPKVDFETGLMQTVRWYQERTSWWKALKLKLVRESKGFWS
ncbi:MAG: dTDP-glucose 4,6-dehydratase [candidate division WOR-3 bacterium]|uniref:dTDP-glucose 4,6-dehydratase n=1 Tax=candidate division WOR-3 bacterium TaxID=2052148 RepID=A0A7C3IJ61_UNCW3|nr:dTDP-glucose 4,6-dehydratase [candidate division WOR-3 bacterium]